MTKVFCLTLFFNFLLFTVNGQVSNICAIDGSVKDSSSFEPVEYAIIRILNTKDSVIAKIFTDLEGKFVLDNLPFGIVKVKISASGYADKIIPNIRLSAEKNIRKLGNIALVSSAKQIDDVIISQDKTSLQLGLDAKVYNVGSDISVNGGSANDVLNNVPSVEVDQDGKISLRGEGNVTILIDGKPSTLSGSNGKSFLDGISASTIERIEVITNPSAKYDPDGTSGIINIVLKKNVKRGVNAQFNLSAGTGDHYTGSVNANIRNTKFNIFATYSYDHKEGYRNNFAYLERTLVDSAFTLDQKRYGTDYSETQNFRTGAEIFINDRNTFSISGTGNTGIRKRFGDQENTMIKSNLDTIGIWQRVAWDPGFMKGIDVNAAFKHELKNELGSLDFSLTESFGLNPNEGKYLQSPLYETNIPELNQQLFSNDKNHFTIAQVDLVRKFKKIIRTESGLKMILRDVNIDSKSEHFENNMYVSDTLADFVYRYREQIFSAYGIVASTYKKFAFQAGLRAEKSLQLPELLSENLSYKNEYFNLFPSSSVRYSASKTVDFNLGYSRRINRPTSESLNPFTSFADPFNLRKGNPSLRPEFIHSIDAGVELKGKKVSFTATFYQRFAKEVINRVKIFYSDGTSAGTFANIDNSINTGGEFAINYKPLPIWRNTVSTTMNYIQYKDATTTQDWNRKGFVFGIKGSSTLELMKKTLTLQLNGRYNAPSVTPSGRSQPRGSVDFSLDKSFSEGKWGMGMRLTDIFDTQGHFFVIDQPGNYQEVTFKWETRRIYFNIRYRFGKTELLNNKKGPETGGGGFDF